jgi:hypothetical protein
MSVQSPVNQKPFAYLRKAKTVSVIPLLLFAATALASDDVDLKITNDGIQDLFVTVYDMNTRPYSILLDHERINGFVSVPISATADMTGLARISWTAINVDASSPRCGHGTRGNLDIHESINVHVDSACPGR